MDKILTVFNCFLTNGKKAFTYPFMLTITILLDSDIQNSIEDNAYSNDDTYVYGGVNVSFSF